MEEEQKNTGKGVNKESRRSGAGYRRTVQIASLVVFVLVIVGATYLCIPLIKAMRTPEGMESVRERLSQYSGLLGVIVFTLLQAIQVIIAIIPPVQIIGGLLFGWLFGAALSFAGTLLGSFVIFSLVRKIGAPIVEAFVSEKHLHKFGFLQDERKLTGILMILYLIPGVPKDVITYIVPLTKVSRRDFFMYVMPCRLPAIFLSTVLGSNVGRGNFRTVIIIAAVVMVIAILGLFFKEPILRRMRERHGKGKNN